MKRRELLALGAAAAAGGIAGATLPRLFSRSPAVSLKSGVELLDIPVRESVDGLLDTTLTARLGPATVDGRRVTARVYEGLFPGPVLRVRAGDTVRVRLVNDLTQHTNLHVHGLHVSPSGNSDNVFLHIAPQAEFQYEYRIPADHSSGLYWYHSHAHGQSNQQINNGMAGAIIIEGALDRLPGIAGLTERLLVLQATMFGEDGVVLPTGKQTNDGWLRLVNGQINPTIRMRPGETQRWRILNASSGTYYNLALAGHRLAVIAKDGNTLAAPWLREAILIGPGERFEVLIQAAPAGSYELRTLLFGQGFQTMRDTVMATLVVEGHPMGSGPLPAALLPFADLRSGTVDVKRLITMETSPAGPTTEQSHYTMNGRAFDPDRVDAAVKLGALEEWTVSNPTDEWHPFHIHVNPFLVVAVNGDPVVPRSYEDTVQVEPGGSITMRTRFLDFTGRYVYHCHLNFHEDGGMMAVVEVS